MVGAFKSSPALEQIHSSRPHINYPTNRSEFENLRREIREVSWKNVQLVWHLNGWNARQRA